MKENATVRKKSTREEMPRDLRKKTLWSIRYTALDRIKRIEARIHRIVLSGERRGRKEYALVMLTLALGNPWFDENFDPAERGGNYGARYIKQSKNFQINLLIGRQEGYLPPFQIEIHPRGHVRPEELKKLLTDIDKKIPGIQVSKVEYAIDQFCYEPVDVESLFWVERYSLYVPNQQGILRELGGGGIKIGKRGRKALIWNIGEKDKIYERGDDDDKEDETWEYEDFNRVRMEHTADRRELKGKGIKTLKDFINKPRFLDLNKKIWNFRRFNPTRSKRRIQEWQNNAVPFQELLKASDLKNPTKYAEEVEQLVPLKSKIVDAMKASDEEWEKS